MLSSTRKPFKPKPCRQCLESFTPIKSIQPECSPRCHALWKQAHCKAKPVKAIKKTKRSSDYKKVYWDFFGYDYGDRIECQIPECGKVAIDLHHINCSGIGGTKKKVKIGNLIALCREHHIELGDKKEHTFMLQKLTQEKIINQLKQKYHEKPNRSI